MRSTIKLLIYWILLYIPIAILLVAFVSIRRSTSDSLDKYAKVQKYVGKRLELKNLLDRVNNRVQLEPSSDITLIDFWFRGCDPCIKEMREFNSLISGLENRINIISISIDDTETWDSMFQKDSPFSFLTKETINWKHYNLIDSTYLTVDSEYIARGSGLDFTNELGLIAFPSYLVLDKNGVLVDLPNSGVDYIRKKLYNQSDFRVFWTSSQMKDIAIKMFIGAFILYSLIYWLIMSIILLIQRHKKKYCC
jgi:thiol-disulfide isomerase/thioredoxin